MANPFLRDELLDPDGLIPRLFALSEAAGLLDKDIAARLGNDASKVTRIKRGQAPSERDVRVWAEATGADPEELLALLGKAREAARFRKLADRRNHADVQERYNELYLSTPLVREFQSAVIPGMLQTRQYAEQMFVEGRDLHAQLANLPDDVERAVTNRMARQYLLYETGHRFEFLIDEVVLRRLVVPPDALRAQLDRLQTVIGLPNVRFGILPLGVRLSAVPWMPFALFVGDQTEALIETPTETRFFEGTDAAPFVNVVDRLWRSAAEGDDARRYIAAAQEALPA